MVLISSPMFVKNALPQRKRGVGWSQMNLFFFSCAQNQVCWWPEAEMLLSKSFEFAYKCLCLSIFKAFNTWEKSFLLGWWQLRSFFFYWKMCKHFFWLFPEWLGFCKRHCCTIRAFARLNSKNLTSWEFSLVCFVRTSCLKACFIVLLKAFFVIKQ